MNTKYITEIGAENPVREPEITRELNRLEEEIRVLNHIVTDLLAKRLKPIIKQVDKAEKDPNTTTPICVSPLGVYIQNLTNSVSYISEVVNEILEDIEI